MPTSGMYQWQIGKETTWGTPVAGSAKVMGMQTDARLKAANRSAVYEDVRGSLAPGYLDGLEEIGGAGNFNLIGTFEDIPYWLDAAFGLATPSGTGPYVYAYTGFTTTYPTPRIMTVIDGSSQSGAGIYRLEGGLVNSLTIEGKTGGPLMVSGDFIGQTVSVGTLAALSDRTVEVIMGQPWTVYVDAAAGTIGTTQITTTAIAFKFSIDLNRTLVRSMDALIPDTWNQGKLAPEAAKLSLTLRYNATSLAYMDALVPQTATFERQIRLKTTSGTKIFQLDFAGIVTEPPETRSDEDGVATMELEFTGKYNSALANYVAASVTNSVSALP